MTTTKVKKFVEENRSYLISTGIHLLLLLLFLNMIVMRHEIKTPIFITKIITNQPIEIKKQQMPIQREEQRPDAGSEGLEGLKGGGMSSPKLQQQLMIKQAQVKQVTKVFTPVQNIRTQIKEIFVPKTQIAVKETKFKSDFRVPMQPKTSVDKPLSGGMVKPSIGQTGTKNTSGLLVYGPHSDSGRPDGIPGGTGIGEQTSGNTGRGGGTGIGFYPFGTGTGSGNAGTGPGAGRQGIGSGLAGSGVGPGSGPGVSITPGGGTGTGIVPPTQPGVIPSDVTPPTVINPPDTPSTPITYKPDAPIGTPENPIKELYIAVEFNGTAGFIQDFYLAYPENRLLIRDAKRARNEVIKLGPYAVPPEQFLFYWDITANEWGISLGVPRNFKIYSNDPRQVRIQKISDTTIRYWLEDMPVDNPSCDRDYDDVIITITYKGTK